MQSANTALYSVSQRSIHPAEMSGNVRTTARSRVRSSSAEPKTDPLRQETTSNRHRTKYETNSTSNFKLFLAITFFLITIFFLIHHFVTSAAQPHLPRVVTPFPAPKIMDLPQVNFKIFITLLLFFCFHKFGLV